MIERKLLLVSCVMSSVVTSSNASTYEKELAQTYAEYRSELDEIVRHEDWNGLPIDKIREREEILEQKYFGYPFTAEKKQRCNEAYWELQNEKKRQQREEFNKSKGAKDKKIEVLANKLKKEVADDENKYKSEHLDKNIEGDKQVKESLPKIEEELHTNTNKFNILDKSDENKNRIQDELGSEKKGERDLDNPANQVTSAQHQTIDNKETSTIRAIETKADNANKEISGNPELTIKQIEATKVKVQEQQKEGKEIVRRESTSSAIKEKKASVQHKAAITQDSKSSQGTNMLYRAWHQVKKFFTNMWRGFKSWF